MAFRKPLAAAALVVVLALMPARSMAAWLSSEEIAALKGPWRGTWLSDTFTYEAEMTLAAEPSGKVGGTIRWTLRRSPRASEQNKLGRTGVEHVRGEFHPALGLLVVEGYRKDDPDNILGLDRYRLAVGENRQTMAGVTRDHGTWKGRFFLRR